MKSDRKMDMQLVGTVRNQPFLLNSVRNTAVWMAFAVSSIDGDSHAGIKWPVMNNSTAVIHDHEFHVLHVVYNRLPITNFLAYSFPNRYPPHTSISDPRVYIHTMCEDNKIKFDCEHLEGRSRRSCGKNCGRYKERIVLKVGNCPVCNYYKFRDVQWGVVNKEELQWRVSAALTAQKLGDWRQPTYYIGGT